MADDDEAYVATPKGLELAMFVIRWWVVGVVVALGLACLSGVWLGWMVWGG